MDEYNRIKKTLNNIKYDKNIFVRNEIYKIDIFKKTSLGYKEEEMIIHDI